MQRGPYSRETTDISDQELRQILESENISGLPAPYCLVPHYDGQGTLPPNAQWPASAALPSLAQRAAENALATSQQQQQPYHHHHHSQMTGHESNSSQSSPGEHDGGNVGRGVDGALAAATTADAAESSGTPRTPLPVATGETSRRRTRTTLTPYQLRVLFRVWERTQYPSSDLRYRLATSLMMTPRNVQIWFQNQRQKTKERAEMRRRTHSPSTHSAVLASMGATQIPHHYHSQRQPLHGPNQHSPIHLLEFRSHDGHISAMSMPGRSPPESPFRYTHGPPPAPPAIPPPTSEYATLSSNAPPRQTLYYHEPTGAGRTSSLRTASPVSGAYTMLTPPALYPQAFSQHSPQQLQSIQPHTAPLHSASYHPHPHHHLPLQPPPLPPMQPPPSLQRTPRHPQHHLHHQRHLSQPHALHYTPARTPSLLAPSSSQKPAGQQPYCAPNRQDGERFASEKGADVGHSQHMLPRTPLPSETAHYVIPSPSTPTSASEQPLSPLAPRRRLPSPPLLSSMHSLSVTPAPGPPGLSSQTVREHPASRRARLVDILNPISATGSAGTPAGSIKGASDSQLGPLPSLGAVLANVQSLEDAGSGASPAEAAIDAASPAPASTAAADKWRPW
ncbi:hypothetical protein GGI20_003975 [Coemansia sp. BCRC 34301]|nr:hypothetical protein GGI20_003975 [Coemansia sp. BCRC 34301]